jgi:antitoxin (DNA-binding transcriptional repressor) of toxin-antitoxin stability system
MGAVILSGYLRGTQMSKVEIKKRRAEIGDLERTREGETVVVTDRGESAAELVPLSQTQRKLLELAKEGKLSWSGGKPKGLRGIVVRGEPMSETVIKARG